MEREKGVFFKRHLRRRRVSGGPGDRRRIAGVPFKEEQLLYLEWIFEYT